MFRQRLFGLDVESSVRRQMRVREAQLQDDTVASDAVLRGTVSPTTREPVRRSPLSLPSR